MPVDLMKLLANGSPLARSRGSSRDCSTDEQVEVGDVAIPVKEVDAHTVVGLVR